jgi:hypothetical protein
MKKFLLILYVFLPISLVAQGYVHNNKGYVDNMLYVKFIDDSNIKLNAGMIDLSSTCENVINSDVLFYGYFTNVHKIPADDLTRLRINAEKNLNKKLPDPNSEFHFHLYSKDNLSAVKEIFRSCLLIESVLEVPIPFDAVAPDYQSGECFITTTTSGIEAQDFWNTYGNRGAGIKICDIEYGFNDQHVDLPSVTIVGPTPQDPFAGGGIDHGTAVFGEIASLNNGTGTTGIASDCEPYFAGAYTDSTYNLESAITYALTVLNAGDVILLEQQIAGPHYSGVQQFGLVPVEWYKPYYDAIVLAVGQNVIVVEAAGNGEQNLDDSDYGTGNGAHWPFLVGNESGAIIVGAGAVSSTLGGTDVPRSRMWYSNYGYAVDIQGNGEAVTTTGYGDLYSIEGVNSYYTDGFGGTSSASPIVTGAVLLLQSLYKDTTGTILTPDQMLNLLASTGKPQQSGDYDLSYNIGPLPNVMQAFNTIYVSVGLEENANSFITLFPNPNNGTFILNSVNENNISNIYVTDLLGKEIKITTLQISDHQFRVEIANPVSGIYMVNYSVGDKNFVKKILVNN